MVSPDIVDERAGGELPTISVVVPVFREGPRIARVLDSILEQTWPVADMEILVADGGSGDETEVVCAQYAKSAPVRFLAVPHRGRAQGLNHAIRNSRGQFVVRVDGRSLVPKDYIERLYRIALQTGAEVVGGVQRAAMTGKGGWVDAVALCMNSVCGAGPAPHRTAARSGPVDNVYLGLYRRGVFERVGYVDEMSSVISEEVDLHYRIIRAGGTVWLDSTMIIDYEPRASVADQLKLYYRYGGGKAAFIRKYGKVVTLRQLVAPGFYLALLILAGLSLFLSGASWIIAGLIVLYVLAVVGCITSAAMFVKRPELIPRASIVAMGMHFGYAIGYMWKLIERPNPGHYWGG